ncbi:unnamed protein product [Ixodes hexagonus]
MKFALLLCLLGWFGRPLPPCNGTDVQQREPESADGQNRSAEPLERAVRAANPSNAEDAGGRAAYPEYRTPQALMGPRRHRFLHFGRKRSLPLYSDFAVDQSDDDHIGDDEDAPSSEYSEDAGRWTQPYERVGLDDDFALSGSPEDVENIRYKRDVSVMSEPDDNLNADAEKKPALVEVHENLAEYGDEGSYADWPDRQRIPESRILRFVKREGQPESAQLGYNKDKYGVKRAKNRIIHFGKRNKDGATPNSAEEQYSSYGSEGKRAGNRIMHFGKRDQEEITGGDKSPGPDDELRRSNKISSSYILHFERPEGIKESDTQILQSIPDKRTPRANRIMHFGKRTNVGLISELNPEVLPVSKRLSNRIMHFGKRGSARSGSLEDKLKKNLLEWKKRYSNRMLHFGKKRRPDSNKRLTNRIMHFGKRDVDSYSPDESVDSTGRRKRQLRNSILHFGKRGNEMSIEKSLEDLVMQFGQKEKGYPYEDRVTADKRLGNRILPFGKRDSQHQREDSIIKRQGGDALLQFANEDGGTTYLVDKKMANRILHFGKRLETSGEDEDKDTDKVEEHAPSVNNDSQYEESFKSEDHKPHKRRKRSLDVNGYDMDETLERVLHELMDAGYPKRVALSHPGLPGHLHLPHAFVAAQVYGSNFPRMLSRPSRSDRFFPVPYSGEHREVPKGPSRNVFLHFG